MASLGNPTSLHSAGQAPLVGFTIVGLIVFLPVVRIWTRRVARSMRFEGGDSRAQMTWRVMRAMSLRLGIILLVIFPLVSAAAGDGPHQMAFNAGSTFGGGLLILGTALLSVWQIARRFSYGALNAANMVLSPHLSEPLRYLDDDATLDGGRLLGSIAFAGLRHRRYWPTAVEGLVATCLAMVVAIPMAHVARHAARVSPQLSTERHPTESMAAHSHKLVVLPTLSASSRVGIARDFDLTEIAKSATSAVALLEVRDKSGRVTKLGTGFWVSEDGKLVTNYHVLSGDDIYVKSSGAIARPPGSGSPKSDFYGWPAKHVLAFDKDWDLVLLQFNVAPTNILKLGRANDLKVGERIAVIGNPQGLEGTVSEGIVSAKRVTDTDAPIIQFTAPISSGSSGSPLLNANCEVVGVASASLTADNTQGLNFAVPSEAVLGLLKAGEILRGEPGEASPLPSTPAPKTRPVSAPYPTKLAQNEEKIFLLLKRSGLSADAERVMRDRGIDAYSADWWEKQIFARLPDAQKRYPLRQKLQERAKLLRSN